MTNRPLTNSSQIFRHNRKWIPGGVVSVNRSVQPEIAFVRARGSRMWDADGNEYIDYHAAFAPHVLGHNDPDVTAAVARALSDGLSLFGTGTTAFEGRLAELICSEIPWIESIQFLNTGSEATAQALRLARAATGRKHIIVMQGGYNGWHNDVACNLMTSLDVIGPRISPGEYPFVPISAGIPEEHQSLVHPVNFNDLDSVRFVCERYEIAALIAEPVLQNVGVIHPRTGYLGGLRGLADRYGFILIFDEVKTGFRAAPGGYAQISGVRPDLAVYGKALANGYPIAALGGRGDLMNYFVHREADKRVLLAGTYNAHPVPTIAAIATVEKLLRNDGEVYAHLERLGQRMENGIIEVATAHRMPVAVARQGSALCVYFMDHCPVDWHDLRAHHAFALDEQIRKELIARGTYVFPLAAKQWSISAAHTEADIQATLEHLDGVFAAVAQPATGG
ncbi:MAG: aminotransferase class III-fold pyridoxal phosphate-dependent enzyme [Bryobacteraceae bacterium]|nr:aminotransferase class III-fold pyridoxal phosphate-dependent enzyme [Bryobacterales bacterium]NUN02217.1 aminotransferase class III-fold pyridoxal phosphate-dependent enzyme [Bryobacteraceae bacterium]